MTTKDRILDTALELYNHQGISAVTSRHIAAAMGISAGNLHYHFKHTDEIIIALYERLSGESSLLIAAMGGSVMNGVDGLRSFTYQAFDMVYRYRFVFLHAVEICLRIPALKKDYQQLIRRRTKEFMDIFRQLVSAGVFRPDIPEKVWNALVTQAFIVFDFWLSNNEIMNNYKGKKAVSHYSEIFLTMFYPYMSRKHQAAFE